MSVNFEIKGMLAKCLAMEDIIIEHKKVETACFNVHTRVLTLPMWEKASKCDKESDIIAVIRTFIFFTYLITNIAIVANAARHWNDNDYNRNSIQTCRDH